MLPNKNWGIWFLGHANKAIVLSVPLDFDIVSQLLQRCSYSQARFWIRDRCESGKTHLKCFGESFKIVLFTHSWSLHSMGRVHLLLAFNDCNGDNGKYNQSKCTLTWFSIWWCWIDRFQSVATANLPIFHSFWSHRYESPCNHLAFKVRILFPGNWHFVRKLLANPLLESGATKERHHHVQSKAL